MPSQAPPVVAPPPRADWLAITKRRWEDLWGSRLAGTIAPETDLPALDRYFTTLDEHERALRAYKRQRLVLGSHGQVAVNPMGRLARDLAGELRQLEDRFGLTPMARLRLGAQHAQTALTLDELNRQIGDRDDDPDPRRLEVVDGDAD